LHYAAEAGAEKIVEMIVRTMAVDIGARNLNGETPLDLAVREALQWTVFIIREGITKNDS